MLVKNLLTLLLAGLAVVTATNSSSSSDAGSSSSSDTQAAGSSSSSDTQATTGSSSSSDTQAATTNGTTSSATQATTGSSSSSDTQATTQATSSATQATTTQATSSATQATTTQATSSATQATTTQATSGATTTQATSSATQGTTNTLPCGTGTNKTGTACDGGEPKAKELFVVKAEVKLTMDVANKTLADLNADTKLLDAVCDGIRVAAANPTGVSFKCTEFVEGRRRLNADRRQLADKVYTVKFTVTAEGTSVTAATVTDATSAINTGLSTLSQKIKDAVTACTDCSVKPTVDAAYEPPALTVGTVETVSLATAGTWSYGEFEDAACSTPMAGTAISSTALGSCGSDGDKMMWVQQCKDGHKSVVSDGNKKVPKVGVCAASNTQWEDSQFNAGACTKIADGHYKKLTCTAGGSAAASSALGTNVAGLLVGIFMSIALV